MKFSKCSDSTLGSMRMPSTRAQNSNEILSEV